MLPNEVFKLVLGCIATGMISVIIMPSSSGCIQLVDVNQLVKEKNISLINHQTGGPKKSDIPNSAIQSTSSGRSHYAASTISEELMKKYPVQQVVDSDSEQFDKPNTLIGGSRRSASSKFDSFLKAKSVLENRMGQRSGKKRVFNFNFINPQSRESEIENMTASASSNRENWATFQVNSLDDSEDTTVAPESSLNQVNPVDAGDQPNASGSEQKEAPASANEESTTADEAGADSSTEAASSTRQQQQQQQQQQVQLEKESFSKTEKPIIRKSSSTLTTIGDGKKKARLVSKSAPLPPGLRRRIIEEFVKKGGNPDNIVISDSTITTTSKSKKKTITTVYKVIPAGGSSSPRQPRKMAGKIPPSSSMKFKQPPAKRFKKIMTVTRDEMPKNMISNMLDRPDKPSTATFTDMGLVEFDDTSDEVPIGKPESFNHKSKRPSLKLRVVPHKAMVDTDDDDDEDETPMLPPTKSKVKAGVGGGGVSLNTLMDAIKHMQQQGKPKLEVADLGLADKEQPFAKHLSNFNDFNGHKSSKKASSLSKQPPSSDTAKNNDDEDEEEEPESEKKHNDVASDTPEVEQKKVNTPNTAKLVSVANNDKVSPEQQLEELKRVVVASTEKLKERRAKTTMTGSGDQKNFNFPNATSGFEVLKTTLAPTTTAKPAPQDTGSSRNSTGSDNSSQSHQRGNSGAKTHNIMMLIDFSQPNKPQTGLDSHRRSTRAHSSRLSLNQPQPGGFFTGPASWFEPDDQWHPLTADTGTNIHVSNHGYPHSFTSGLPVDSLMQDEQFGLDSARQQMPMTSESDSFAHSFDYMDTGSDDRGSRRGQLMGASFGVPVRSHHSPRALPEHLYDMTSASNLQNNYRQPSGPLRALFGGGSSSAGTAPHSLAASSFMSLIHRAPGFHHHHHPHKLSSYSNILPEESRRTNQLVNDVIEELVMSASNEMGSMSSSNETRPVQLYSVTGSHHPTYQLNHRRK